MPKHAILSGCGGGYDSYLGIPLRDDLLSQGVRPIMVNLSFEKKEVLDSHVKKGIVSQLTSVCFCVDASAVLAVITCYFPEFYLSRALGQPVYIIHNGRTIGDIVGAYEAVMARENVRFVEKIYLMEGGCDAVLAGSETKLGTPTEDMMHLRAVAQLRHVKQRFLCAIGMNIDTAHGVHPQDLTDRLLDLDRRQVLLNRAQWSLTDANVQHYRDVVRQCRPVDSIINSLVCAALDGHRGFYTPEHLKARIGEAVVPLTDLTCTMHTFDLDRLVASMDYLHRLQNNMTYADVDKFIKTIILPRNSARANGL